MEEADQTFRQLAATADANPNIACENTCTLKGIQGYNAKAAIIYLKLYEKALAAPTAADTPKKTLAIPASGAFVFDFPAGIKFRGGLSYRVTSVAADADNTALVASDFTCLNLDYRR